MDLKSAIEKLKGIVEKFSTTKFGEEVLKNGSIINVEGEVAVGSAVSIMEAEAEVPAPDGDYELEDGRVLKVSDGVIAEVVEAPAEEGGEEGTELSKFIETATKDIKEMADSFKATTEKITAIEDRIGKLEMSLTESKEVNGEMFKVVEALAAKADGTPTKTVKNPFKKVDTTSALENLVNSIKTINSKK